MGTRPKGAPKKNIYIYIYAPPPLASGPSLPQALWLHFCIFEVQISGNFPNRFSSDWLWSHHDAARSMHLQTRQFPTNISVHLIPRGTFSFKVNDASSVTRPK